MQALVASIPLVLLAGATALGGIALARTRGFRISDRTVSLLGCLAPTIGFVLSLVLFSRLGDEPVRVEGWQWMAAGNFSVDVSLAVDHLNMVLLLVITGIGSLIHGYSTGYMKGDPAYARYFCYLNLFMFFMLVLVTAENLPLLFVGWEGVGLSSYLLIGFWWKDLTNARAGMKAFLVNRIGDAGFVLGMLLVYKTAGTLSFEGLAQFVADHPDAFLKGTGVFGITLATASGLLMFLGATGKSAQVPLYVWLPDAMAGPTPVSALIHAATMVTAGVYLLARLDFLFAMSHTVVVTVSMVGALTAVFAATIAVTQTDIKKVLAYSTISQLGYMFVAVGLGAVSVAIFHLVTHAFFKACLFLGSGSVIHAMSGGQDMTKMGGLRRRMPVTFLTMSVAALAMTGIPPLAGFFSKDEILWRAFSSDVGTGWFLWVLGVLAAFCTAFYMGRLIILTFFGRCRADEETKAHIHESPRSMTSVLVILAVGSAFVGLLGVPHFLGGHNLFGHYVDVSVTTATEVVHDGGKVAVEFALAFFSVLIAVVGLFLAWRFYVKDPETPARLAKRHEGLYELVRDKYRVDEFYDDTVVKPIERVAQDTLFQRIDRSIIDRTVNRVGSFFRGLGGWVAASQTGSVRLYVAVMIGGVLLVMLTLLS